MKPPICELCDKDFRNSDVGGIVYFKKRLSDEEWIERMEEKNMVGHPPYAAWFCEKHFAKAKELEHFTITEAIRNLRRFFKMR